MLDNIFNVVALFLRIFLLLLVLFLKAILTYMNSFCSTCCCNGCLFLIFLIDLFRRSPKFPVEQSFVTARITQTVLEKPLSEYDRRPLVIAATMKVCSLQESEISFLVRVVCFCSVDATYPRGRSFLLNNSCGAGKLLILALIITKVTQPTTFGIFQD